MRPDVDTAMHRVTVTRARLAGVPATAATLGEVEDALGLGYLVALQADAWLMERERLLDEQVGDSSLVVSLTELRTTTRDLRTYRRAVNALRRELAGLRDEHERPAVRA